MPRGYDHIATGSELSPKLTLCADELVHRLRSIATLKDNKRTAEQICKFFLVWNKTKVQPSDVRAMVNHLRRNRYPIASCQDGYFWATRPEELDDVIASLEDRLKAIRAASNGLEDARFTLAHPQRQEQLFDNQTQR